MPGLCLQSEAPQYEVPYCISTEMLSVREIYEDCFSSRHARYPSI